MFDSFILHCVIIAQYFHIYKQLLLDVHLLRTEHYCENVCTGFLFIICNLSCYKVDYKSSDSLSMTCHSKICEISKYVFTEIWSKYEYSLNCSINTYIL